MKREPIDDTDVRNIRWMLYSYRILLIALIVAALIYLRSKG